MVWDPISWLKRHEGHLGKLFRKEKRINNEEIMILKELRIRLNEREELVNKIKKIIKDKQGTPEERSRRIGEINDKLLNKKVKVQGTIFNIRSYEDSDFQVISIKDKTGKIDITTNKILDLKNNQQIIVTGTIKEYKEFLQIQADKIIIK